MNESMADYSQTLWMEYKHGKDAGDEENQKGLTQYLSNPNEAKKDLVRFRYADKEDVFDLVSYQKGGRVHQMLRNYVGEEAYFKSLNNYLTTNKFKPGESGQMRLAFEEVTGQDMNWFWNQWFYGSGHPIVKIDYAYDDAAGKATVTIEQTQKTDKVFKLPIAIDVYAGSTKKRYNVWVQNKIDTFTFNYTQHPDLINVDADKVMLWAKTDNKTADNYVKQWKSAPLYLDRREALEYFNKKGMKELAEGLKDKYAPLRKYTIDKLAASKFASDADVVAAVEKLSATEKDKKTLASAIDFLGKTKNAKYADLYKRSLNDVSYSVAGAALTALNELEPANAYAMAKKYSSDAKDALGEAVGEVLMSSGTEADFDFLLKRYDDAPLSQEKLGMTTSFGEYLEKVNNNANVKKGIDAMMKFRKAIPQQFRNFTDPTFKQVFEKLGKAKGKDIEDYIAAGMKE